MMWIVIADSVMWVGNVDGIGVLLISFLFFTVFLLALVLAHNFSSATQIFFWPRDGQNCQRREDCGRAAQHVVILLLRRLVMFYAISCI